MAANDRRTLPTIIALVVTLGSAGVLLSKVEIVFAGTGHFMAYELIWWTMLALLLLYVRWGERRPLTSVGFRKPGLRDILISIATGILIFAGLVGIYFVILPALHFQEDAHVTQLMNLMLAKPRWWRFTLIMRGAIAEEVLFRGYAIERLHELTGSLKIAATLSCTVFALEHLGVWSWGHVIIAGFAGAMLSLLYIWRRNLWANSIAHFIPDAIGLLLN